MSRKHPLGTHPDGQSTRWLRVLVVTAVVVIVGLILAVKTQPQKVSPTDAANPDVLPEQQLKQLMQTGIPTLAFYHSNNCEQCLQMVEIVEKVYPEFTPSVGLVDVNVYDERNANLLQMARIRVIPTLVFFDSKGQGEVFMGVMQPEQLRERLRTRGRH